MATLPEKVAALVLAAAAALASGQNTIPNSINLPIQSQPTLVPINSAVWGFADLHTHPASFLGFGATNEMNGLLWGKPAHDGAMDLATSSEAANITSDLPQCPQWNFAGATIGPTHNSSTGDPITLATDALIVSQLDALAPSFNHQASGAPGFQYWPAALTVDHQVMHINSIHRAYQGGLRLMFAAATDDELITDVWNQKFNSGGSSGPQHSPTFDYNSAFNQLTYITNLVNANSSWMQIVKTPADARAAINSGKLAVVLSLEMDELSLSDIQKLILVDNFPVAHVIPVHLADNSFGGTAAYSDLFNGLSNFINGAPESTQSDPNVNFTFSTPVETVAPISASSLLSTLEGFVSTESSSTVVSQGALITAVTSYVPGFASAVAGAAVGVGGTLEAFPTGAFGYMPILPTTPGSTSGAGPGQINTRDLNKTLFYPLMEMGLMLDVAHMGQKTAASALNMAQQYHYPLMDSHTGIRCDDANLVNGLTTSGFPPVNCNNQFAAPWSGQTAQVDERALPLSQVAVLHQLGGVIGFGMTPPGPDNPVVTWLLNYTALLGVMGGKGVAIGTDADGLSPMISGDTQATGYPITVAQTFGCPSGCPASLPQYQLIPPSGQPGTANYSPGSHVYNFQSDGIANYGMLPDFIQAASQPRPILPGESCVAQCGSCVVAHGTGGKPVADCTAYQKCVASCPKPTGVTMGPAPTAQITALFHSAEDVIEMWEKVQADVLITSPNLGINPQGQLYFWFTGTTEQPFSQTLTATGGTPPYKWSLQSGSSLPPGLALSQAGVISGTPSSPSGGATTFTVQVQDSATPVAATSSQLMQIGLAAVPCMQNPTHQIISCGTASPKTCVVAPFVCPTCPETQTLINGVCTAPIIHPISK
jgi:microsomal dipeptidase-like Zn-dependent dipeptidase